jgi:hypothetical protein
MIDLTGASKAGLRLRGVALFGQIRLHPRPARNRVGLFVTFVHSVPLSEPLRKSLQDRPDGIRVALSHHFPI